MAREFRDTRIMVVVSGWCICASGIAAVVVVCREGGVRKEKDRPFADE